jgi:glyceraldehyde 3-phosphate dehydrogenase
MRIAINGFGRIGRSVFKILFDNGMDVVAVNDVHGTEDAKYLLQHDSVYGWYNKEIKTDKEGLIIGGKKIKVISEREPSKLPWKKLGVDIVVEATGVFRDRAGAGKHIKAGAKKVVITAPSENPDITIVPGVNSDKLKDKHKIIAVASCTTNCLAPLVDVINKEFKISKAMFTTVHAYTNDQTIHDESHKKLRRGRAAFLNMIPTSTGANEAVASVLPELLGKIKGLAVRVPIAVGSLLDLVAEVKTKADAKKVNSVLKKYSEGKLKGIMQYSEDELVSSDIIGNSNSCIIDALNTQVEGDLIKVIAWYDNEYGYSCRVADVIGMIENIGK